MSLNENAPSMETGPLIVVISDLHLSEGFNEATQRFSPLEDFFYDEEFGRFIDHLIARGRAEGRTIELVLNGDIFDYLQVVSIPDEVFENHIHVSRKELKYGLDATITKTKLKVRMIVEGHRLFFLALTRFVRELPGSRIVFIRGNHDVENYWSEITDEIVERMQQLDQSTPLENAIVFKEWFYYIKGRIYVEHGNQYEQINSYVMPLVPVLDAEMPGGEPQILHNLGSLFVRYIYNKVDILNPFATAFVSARHYVKHIFSYNIFRFTQTVWINFKSFFLTLRESASQPNKSMRGKRALSETIKKKIAAREGIAVEKINLIESFQIRPKTENTFLFFKELVMPGILKAGKWMALLLLLGYAWLFLGNLIEGYSINAGVKSAMQAFSYLFVTVVIFWAIYSLGSRIGEIDPIDHVLVEKASRIAAILDVPVVAMGHTHSIQFVIIGYDSTFVNTGSWTPVVDDTDNIVRDSKKFPVLIMEGRKPRLCRWNDSSGRLDRIILV